MNNLLNVNNNSYSLQFNPEPWHFDVWTIRINVDLFQVLIVPTGLF